VLVTKDGLTVKRYASFVLRCWRLEDDQRRIEVEHVQSGVRTRVSSLAAALDWMEGRWGLPAEPSLIQEESTGPDLEQAAEDKPGPSEGQ